MGIPCHMGHRGRGGMEGTRGRGEAGEDQVSSLRETRVLDYFHSGGHDVHGDVVSGWPHPSLDHPL